MQTGEGHHVDGKLPQISIELSREPKASGDSGHGQGDQMVQVTIGGVGELQGPEADVIQSFVVNTVGFISVLDKLMYGEGGIVWFNNSV